MLHGFRWKDKFDWKSCPPKQTPTFGDQFIAIADGVKTQYQLIKTYGSAYSPYTREIKKPVLNTVLMGRQGFVEWEGWSVNYTTGIVTYDIPPTAGHEITAGYEFDVPVRFDTDYLQIDLSAFDAGNVPDIPIVEIRV